MGRVMSIDYGRKRVGLAVTDPLKIIATALDTVGADRVLEYIETYRQKEEIELFVVGLPKNLDNTDAESMADVKPFVKRLEKKFDIPIVWVDERYTSKLAMRAMIDAGIRKSERRKKENTDKISAVIILQSYLESITLK
ncbi:MAG: Holliday junction resolvase RuvX [Prevotellaceae bacterium]|jgi:putative Holliday junction resolvase|nr:Holliday junction resolvase RuvX [Prevotellaceae bacterium]